MIPILNQTQTVVAKLSALALSFPLSTTTQESKAIFFSQGTAEVMEKESCAKCLFTCAHTVARGKCLQRPLELPSTSNLL